MTVIFLPALAWLVNCGCARIAAAPAQLRGRLKLHFHYNLHIFFKAY